ncbi:MAG: DUF4878 domain-containing protein [Phycisphaeraceae bacterium]|nr:DUF4878 domain-containing protein [Phycisphaeraceae bacterium]
MSLSKFLLRVVVAVSMSIALVSCGGGGNTPEGVAKKWQQALARGDTAAVRSVMSPSNRDGRDNAEIVASTAKEFAKAMGGLDHVTVVKTEKDGDDKAKVTLSVKFKKEAEADTVVVTVVKEKGKWYVAG